MYTSGSVSAKEALIILCFLCSFPFGTSVIGALEPVSVFDDGFAVPAQASFAEASFNYPGAETFLKSHFAAVAWSRPFGLDELAVTTIHAGTNIGDAGISLSYSGSGFDLYGDELEKIGASYKFFDSISFGVRFTRNSMRIKGFGDASALSADAGIIVRPVKSVWLAFAYEDFLDAEIGESREPLDGRTRFGLSWNLPGDITIIGSITRVRLFGTSLCGGCTVKLFESLTVGMTGGNEPDRLEFLALLPISKMRCSYRGIYHRDMEMSHGFSISWVRE